MNLNKYLNNPYTPEIAKQTMTNQTQQPQLSNIPQTIAKVNIPQITMPKLPGQEPNATPTIPVQPSVPATNTVPVQPTTTPTVPPTTPQLPTDSLKSIAQQHGLVISAPDKNNVVTVTNPATGQTIQFANNGAHPEYGMTGIVDNYNRVGDSNKFLTALGIYSNPYQQKIDEVKNEMENYPEFQGTYGQQIKELIANIMSSKFNYDPNTDQGFQTAKKAVTQNALELANERGIVNSTVAADNVNQAVINAEGEYKDKAYAQYQNDLTQKMNMLSYIEKLNSEEYDKYNDKYQKIKDLADYTMKLDDRSYGLYKDTVNQQYEQKKAEYEQLDTQYKAQQKQIDDAWKDVENRGYADNNDSIILGIPVGTPSSKVRAAALTRQQKLDDDKRKLAETQAKDERNFQQQKQIIDYRDSVSDNNKAASGKNGSADITDISQVKTLNQLKTVADDDSGEDIYNAIIDGKTSLKPGTSDYNSAIKYARDKYYQQVKGNLANGAYKDLESILKKGAFGDSKYYINRLGINNYNSLINAAKLKKKAETKKKADENWDQ